MRCIWHTGAVLCCLAGCGLADYEKRMDEQRERLKTFDEEAALLYDLIEQPKGKDAQGNEIAVPFDVFLRLPKGMSGTFKGREAIYAADKQALYRYAGIKPDVNVLVAWERLADPKAPPTGKEGEVSQADFRARVRGGLLDFITRVYSVSANLPDFGQLKKDPRHVVRGGHPRTLEFDSAEFVDSRQNRYFIYLHHWGDRQAAVIYQLPAQLVDASHLRAIDVSLKSLEITGIAATMRINFMSRK